MFKEKNKPVDTGLFIWGWWHTKQKERNQEDMLFLFFGNQLFLFQVNFY